MPSGAATTIRAIEVSTFTTDAKAWSDVAANVAQVVALAIGGWWAYTKFIRHREEWPRVTVEQVVSRRELDQDHSLLRVAVKAINDGTVLVEIEDVRVYVYQVLPLAPETEEALRNETLIAEGDTEATWPCLETRHQTWKPDEVSIEPGESDEFGFDFIVPASVKTVFIYCYIRNEMQKERQVGWQLSQFYDLEDGGESEKRSESLSGKTASR